MPMSFLNKGQTKKKSMPVVNGQQTSNKAIQYRAERVFQENLINYGKIRIKKILCTKVAVTIKAELSIEVTK